VGGDHAGFSLKGPVVDALRQWGHTVTDVGTHTPDPVDFPDIARTLCAEIIAGRAERGIMVCGTGVGATIVGDRPALDLIREYLQAEFSTSEEFHRRVANLEALERSRRE
jgi:ribose 5-phosphate isomerase B